MADASKSAEASDPKALFYESFARNWDSRMNMPELDKRLRLVFGGLLEEPEIRGKDVLDSGAGTGWFSRGLARWGGRVTSLDVGPELMDQVRKKCESRLVVGSVLDLPFPDASFDAVLCTEVIEHTTDPARAVFELCRVLRPGGGVLALTVPNRAWHWAVRLANALRLRPYRGHENWVGYDEPARWVRGHGLAVCRHFGFNPLPHTFFCRPAFDGLDRVSSLHPRMINIALKAAK
jgi:2-polyprenyl-6-hydroxyphenyl methylase/3-demethylubiquinone-9 3-methyltransferase